jgi:predicted peroxiredoxin
MARLLVHIATGPDDPTRAELGLLVARTAISAGHSVDLFFAGDGVGGLPVTMASPDRLVELTSQADRVLVY